MGLEWKLCVIFGTNTLRPTFVEMGLWRVSVSEVNYNTFATFSALHISWKIKIHWDKLSHCEEGRFSEMWKGKCYYLYVSILNNISVYSSLFSIHHIDSIHPFSDRGCTEMWGSRLENCIYVILLHRNGERCYTLRIYSHLSKCEGETGNTWWWFRRYGDVLMENIDMGNE